MNHYTLSEIIMKVENHLFVVDFLWWISWSSKGPCNPLRLFQGVYPNVVVICRQWVAWLVWIEGIAGVENSASDPVTFKKIGNSPKLL